MINFGENNNHLVEKWSKAEGDMSVANIENKYMKECMSVLLENQTEKYGREILRESKGTVDNTFSQTHNGQQGAFEPISLALVRRTFPNLFANNIVGIQAMSGPVGLAYALRFTYADDGFNEEAAFDKVPEYSGYTGSSVTSAGGTSGTADQGTGVVTSAGERWDLENTADTGLKMPELGLQIDKVAIEAKTRKLAASFSIEATQDIQAMHGVNVEREMVDVVQYEVQAEIDRELLDACKNVAQDDGTFNTSSTNGRWSQEHFANLVNRIVKTSNDIGTRTRRGVGNFVVVSTNVATAIQSLQNGQFTANKANVNASNNFAEIGTINGVIKVYRDTYNTDDTVLVGYKGPSTADSGVIFSPYIMGLFNRAMAQEDFTPRIGVMSRYAITNNLLGASRYYTKFIAANMDVLL